jgi:hypothetical protein
MSSLLQNESSREPTYCPLLVKTKKAYIVRPGDMSPSPKTKNTMVMLRWLSSPSTDGLVVVLVERLVSPVRTGRPVVVIRFV